MQCLERRLRTNETSASTAQRPPEERSPPVGYGFGHAYRLTGETSVYRTARAVWEFTQLWSGELCEHPALYAPLHSCGDALLSSAAHASGAVDVFRRPNG